MLQPVDGPGSAGHRCGNRQMAYSPNAKAAIETYVGRLYDQGTI